MARMVEAGTYITNDENKIYTKPENNARKYLYRTVLGHCCMPDCPSGVDLHTHHILPVRKGGTDDYTNYVVLCKYCHTHNHLHSWQYDRRLEITVYKLYIEKMELGFSSDEMSNAEFRVRLLRLKKARQSHV